MGACYLFQEILINKKLGRWLLISKGKRSGHK